jgi:N-acetylglutamate synthase-like GNAT family acetyltransferase
VSLVIRRAHPDDAPLLATLARAHAATITPEYVAEHAVFIALEGTRLVGFYALEEQGERCTLGHLRVAPEWTGRGRGRWMLADAVRRARRIHARTVRLTPEPGSEAFFLRMGLVPAADGAGLELDATTWAEPLPESVSDAGSAE